MDAELKKSKMQRDNKQGGIKGNLQNNHNGQEQLRGSRQLEKELTAKINQNDKFQAEANQVFKSSLIYAHHIY